MPSFAQVTIEYFASSAGNIKIDAWDESATAPAAHYEPDYNDPALGRVFAEIISKVLIQRSSDDLPDIKQFTLDAASKYLSFDPTYPLLKLPRVPDGSTTVREILVNYYTDGRERGMYTIGAKDAASGANILPRSTTITFCCKRCFRKCCITCKTDRQ